MSLVRLVVVLILASTMIVSILGATLRGLTDPAAVVDVRERWEMLGLGSAGLCCGGAALALLLSL